MKEQSNLLGFPVTMTILVVVLAVLPLLGVYPLFLSRVLVMAIAASGFNLLLSLGGLLSFGHAMFFGIAAYLAAHAASVWGFGPLASIALGMLASAALAVLVGLVTIRKRGIAFAMTTLAIAQMIYFFCLQAPFTHGEDGIQSVPRGSVLNVFDLARQQHLYAFVAVCFVGCMLVMRRLTVSPFGLALVAIRDHERRAASLGYKVDTYKKRLLVASALIAGLAGSLKVFVSQSASLSDVHWALSGSIILMALLGGTESLFGPVVGAFIIVALEEFGGAGRWVTVLTGVILILCVSVFRGGVVAAASNLVTRLTPKPEAVVATRHKA